ncbi:ABC transporter substrate-binding protein [Paenibacillus cremeus]|uniref:Extracellular solute-binding protein n=1 Tax=Paenibacillus cremeus TaxID=2163881 RepID=A0A559K770_9BACL|nr:extracellular solute-binding protein [Paenibacillus cremeus]TVY07982.1 extracellular solute-binding protein [Paenibacillus cremeus]
MKKILAVSMTAMLGTSMILAGCGSTSTSPKGSSAAPSQEAKQPDQPKTLKIIFTNAQQPSEKEYVLNTYVKNFEKKYNVKVDAEIIPQADLIKKIGTEQQTGNVVTDVVVVDTANMAPYINGGWTQDISKIVAGTGVTLTNMFDGSTNKDGKRFFAPISFDVYLTMANKKALKYLPAGLTDKDVVTGLTWDQYSDWAVAIAKGEGTGKTMYPSNLTSSQLLYPLGGMGLAYGAQFPQFDNAGFMDAMKNVEKMAKGNAFYAEQAQYTSPTDPMKKGDVWLAFAHMGPLGVAYSASPNDFIVGAAPKGSKGAGSTAGAWTVGIQKGAKNQQAAEDFVKYVMDPKVDYQYTVAMGGYLSPIKQVSDLLEPTDVIQTAGSKMLDNTIISGVPSTDYTDWNAVKLLYGDLFNKILKDKALPDAAYFKDMQGKLDGLKKK